MLWKCFPHNGFIEFEDMDFAIIHRFVRNLRWYGNLQLLWKSILLQLKSI